METHTEALPNDSKPIILISAGDLSSASVLISEIIEEKVLENELKATNKKTWRIINKYYRVDVELYALTDNDSLPATVSDEVEAHVIFITDEEDDEAVVALAERRRERAAPAARRAAVRLLVTAGAAAPALRAWARRRHYEPVPLRRAADDDEDDDDDEHGAARARAALHAHAWRGLERLDRPPRAPLPPPEATSSDDDYEGREDEDEDDEAAVERAEAFAEALGALGAAGAEARALAGDERLRRAERLVAAFCRALGADAPAP